MTVFDCESVAGDTAPGLLDKRESLISRQHLDGAAENLPYGQQCFMPVGLHLFPYVLFIGTHDTGEPVAGEWGENEISIAVGDLEVSDGDRLIEVEEI